jgi:hypothetical protein
MAGMNYLHRLAHRLTKRRVTFAQPRAPKPTDADEIAGFCRRHVPMRFVGALLFLAAIGAVMSVVAGIVGAFILP